MDQRRQGPREAARGVNRRLGGRPHSTSGAAYFHADARLQFLDAMRAAGIVPTDPEAIVGDGIVHSFHAEGDKRSKKSGWAVLHMDGVPAGAFGNHHGDIKGTWHAGRGAMSPAQRERIRAGVMRVERQRNAEQWAKWRDAQTRARQLWARGAEPHPDHPYLRRKRVAAHGIHQSGELLLVPMRDGDGELWNVQTITAHGIKRFLSGGRKRGLYHAIGNVEGELLIAEGYATTASLFESTGRPVAVAFDCGNLEPVAKVLRAKFPAARITLCADNDTGTEGNPGLTKATEAARAIGGYVATPPDGYNDFNDATRWCRHERQPLK